MAVPIQVTFDCADPDRLAHFWADLLGYQLDPPPAGLRLVGGLAHASKAFPRANGTWPARCQRPRGARASHLLPARSRAEGAEEQGPSRRERRRTSRHARRRAARPLSTLRSTAPSVSGPRRSASSKSAANATTSCRTLRATSSACSSRKAGSIPGSPLAHESIGPAGRPRRAHAPLRVDGSELPPEVVRAEVESFLASAPAAWDPYLVSR